MLSQTREERVHDGDSASTGCGESPLQLPDRTRPQSGAAQVRPAASNRRRNSPRTPRAVQRGASYVEHLVLIGMIALALMGAFRALQQAYAALAGDEGKAIATFEWSRTATDGVGPLGPLPNDDSSADEPKDSDGKKKTKKCDGWWDCAWHHTKDFGVELAKAAKDDVVGMVTGTVKLVHNLVTDPKGVYEDGKAIVDAIRKDPLGSLKQLVWDDETSKLWADGDYGGAFGRTFWNVGSNFIPYGGQAAKLSKIGKIAKAADKVSDAAKAGDKISDAAKAGDKISDAAKAGDKISDGKKAADKVTDAAGKKADDLPHKDTPDAPDGCEGGKCKASKCFAAGTLVHTADGDRPIESLKEGELVWSRNENGDEIGLRPIAHVFVTPDRQVLNLGVETDNYSESITVTPGHPFWVEGEGWIQSDKLAEGATLWSPEGLRRLRRAAPSNERITVYNLEVEGFHTYFVGELHTWVHNKTVDGCGGSDKTDGEKTDKPGSRTDKPSWLSPDWGRNRLVKELHRRGFTLKKPTREGGGLIYENSAGDQIRIMPKPKGPPTRSSPTVKWENDYYFRYKPADGPSGAGRWGPHTTIPNKD